MEKKLALYISIGMIALLIAFASIQYRCLMEMMAKAPPSPKLDKGEAPVRYRVVRPREREGPMSDFEKIFVGNPREDVGGNIVDAWRHVPEEEANEVAEVLERNIEELEIKVKRDPEDEKARHKLKISKMMKELIDKGFDIGTIDEPTEE
jgi:hypothetical protein